MKRMLMIGLAGLLSTCKTETGSFLELVSVAAPNAQCVFESDGDLFFSEGFFDPAVDVDRQYEMTLRLINHATATDDDTAETFGDRPFRNSINQILVSGFNICFYRADESRAAEFGAFDDGELVDCEDLPDAQTAFVTGSGEIPEGDGVAIVGTSLLSEAALQAPGIFGEDFELDEIPFAELGNDEGRTGGTEGAGPWGNYPTQRESRLVIQVQAVGKTAGGRSVQSNWLLFPIDICINCLDDFCQPHEFVTCPDGDPGVQGTVIDDEASCVATQSFGISCTVVDTCL